MSVSRNPCHSPRTRRPPLTPLFLVPLLLFCVPSLMAQVAVPTDEAQLLYGRHQASVCQVRVVDLKTGKKSSIGTGFRIGDRGLFATNFHVVAQAVHKPGQFRVEALRDGAVLGELTVIGIDVVHDLAVASGPGDGEPGIAFGRSDLAKGTRLFAMGNPFDLGMTIVEGTYNGLRENSLYRKILFSGSLNPGMSGGPTLDREGRLVGVNVSTAGNEVSFLVPAEHLEALARESLERGSPPPEGWEPVVERQLVTNQDDYMDQVLTPTWKQMTVGGASVPGEILEAIRCWGKTRDEKDNLFDQSDVHCSSGDKIFISSSFTTGEITYRYRWLTSDRLGSLRFATLVEDSFSDADRYRNAGESDVGNFTCSDDFVDIEGSTWKAALCARPYRKYPSLFDACLVMASVDRPRQALLVEAQLLGVSREKVLAFAEKLMGGIRWAER